MTPRTWRIIDWAIPVATTVGLNYLAEQVNTLKQAGGWRAVAAGVLIVGGRAAYQWVKEKVWV